MRRKSPAADRRSCWFARKNRLSFGSLGRRGKRGFLVLCLTGVSVGPAPGQAQNPMVDRVGSTGFVQLQADSFASLSPREKALAYWLFEAAIAIHPIIFDQESRFGLRQKRVLEMIAAHPAGVDPAAYSKLLAFTK